MMLDAAEVAKHNTKDSCWVILNNQVYDLTKYLNSHPGGSAIILQHGGQDASTLFNPIHPKGTIDRALKPEQHLGPVDPTTIQTSTQTATPDGSTPNDDAMTPEKAKRILTHCFNVTDIMRASEKVIPRAANVYYNSAADDLRSHRNNAIDWHKVSLRPRILRNVRKVSTASTLLGSPCKWPLFIAPAARAQLSHEDGELCLARTAGRKGIPYCVSSVASIPHDEISRAFYGTKTAGALWFQLYIATEREVTMQRIQAAIDGGYTALVVTVDSAVIGKREEDERHRAEISAGSLAASFAPPLATPGGEEGATAPREVHAATFEWEDLRWVREAWGNRGPIGIKGIQTAEDAAMAVEYGVDAIYLSNHGGRQCDDAPSALRTLLEIRKFYPQIITDKKVQILLDGGVRRGSDVIKALCLGANGIAMGRPFMYSVAFGDEGVAKTVDVITDEIQTTMRLIGATSLQQLDASFVNAKLLDLEVPDALQGAEPLLAKL